MKFTHQVYPVIGYCFYWYGDGFYVKKFKNHYFAQKFARVHSGICCDALLSNGDFVPVASSDLPSVCLVRLEVPISC